MASINSVTQGINSQETPKFIAWQWGEGRQGELIYDVSVAY